MHTLFHGAEKSAVHFGVVVPFIGDASAEGAARDFTEEAEKGRCQTREIPNSSRLGVSSAEKSRSGRGARVAESKRLSQKAAVWATGP